MSRFLKNFRIGKACFRYRIHFLTVFPRHVLFLAASFPLMYSFSIRTGIYEYIRKDFPTSFFVGDEQMSRIKHTGLITDKRLGDIWLDVCTYVLVLGATHVYAGLCQTHQLWPWYWSENRENVLLSLQRMQHNLAHLYWGIMCGIT